MYRRIVALGLLPFCTAAWSAPYVGIGYQAGASRVEQDSQRQPVVDGRVIDQSGHESTGGLRLLGGYSFNDNWALELGVHRNTLEDGIEERVTGTGDDEEWESSIRSTHITLGPVYLHRFSERTSLRLTAGLLYGDYELKRTHWLDVDNGPDQLLSRATQGDSRLGATAGIGIGIQTPWKFEVLAEALHQRTRLLSNSSLALGVVYRF